LFAATFSMTLRRRHTRPLRPAPRALPTPTFLGNLIVRHAGPLSLDLLNRNVETGGQVGALSQAIVDCDDAKSREAALKLEQLDPGHPDAVQLLDLLRAHTTRELN
jgi:hypothetical protein